MKIRDLVLEEIRLHEQPVSSRPYAWQFEPQTDPLGQLMFRTPGAQGPVPDDPAVMRQKQQLQTPGVPGQQVAHDPASMVKLAGVSTSGPTSAPGDPVYTAPPGKKRWAGQKPAEPPTQKGKPWSPRPAQPIVDPVTGKPLKPKKDHRVPSLRELIMQAISKQRSQ